MSQRVARGRTDSASIEVKAEPEALYAVFADATGDALTGEMTISWRFEPIASASRVTIKAENVPPGISQADHDAGLRSSLDNRRNFID